jgi:hypothetical protein
MPVIASKYPRQILTIEIDGLALTDWGRSHSIPSVTIAGLSWLAGS